MANYDSNYAIAQEISARIGTSPIPFDSVYSIALEIYNELGGEPAEFDSVYSILLGILPLVEGGVASKVIDDSVISSGKTWSSSKINSELGEKQNTLTAGSGIVISGDTISCNVEPGQSLVAGQNISIDSANTISADGYIYNSSNGSFKHYDAAHDGDTSTEGDNTATGLNSAVFGQNNHASNEGSGVFAGQSNNVNADLSAIVGGFRNTISNSGIESAIIGGQDNNVGNILSIVVGGMGNTASGRSSATVGGELNTASAQESATVGGNHVTASGRGAVASGCRTIASGKYSHTEGWGGADYPNTASGDGSHAEGCGTTAQNMSEHAQGSNNVSHKASNDFGSAGNTLHSVGDSNLMNIKNNAFEIMQNADMYIKGVGGYDGVHIKGQDSGITVHTVQEVVNSLETSVAGKQDTLTAGTNITISGTTISATYEVATTSDIEALFS